MKTNKYLIAIIFLFCIFCVIAIIGKIFTLNDLPINFMTTLLGVIITVVITSLLLKEQSKAEEEKNKNVKVFEKKSLLFENFNGKLFKIVMNQKISAYEYIEIKSEFYSKLMLYLDEKSQNKIINYLADIGNYIGVSFDAGIYNKEEINISYEKIKENIYNIINILAEDLNFGGKINISSQRLLDDDVFPKLFRGLLLEEINKIFSNERIFNKAKYRVMANGTFLVLDSNGKYTSGSGIHIGPFFNYTANEKFPAYDGIIFRFFSPTLNPLSELYAVNDGTNYNKLLIDFEESKNGLLDLQEPHDSWVFNKIKFYNNIYNERIEKIRFDEPNTLNGYASIYTNIAKIIAARAFYYYKYAKTKKDNLTIKELYEKFESITDEQYFEHVMKTLSTSIDFSK